MQTRPTGEPRRHHARALVGLAVFALVLGARCVHGNVSVEEVCASSALHFDTPTPPPSVKAGARSTLALPSDLAAVDTRGTVSQSALLDVRMLFRDLAADVTPLRLTLTAAAGLSDFSALESIVVTLAPVTDDPSRPTLVVAEKLLSPDDRRRDRLTLPLTLTSDELARYARNDPTRLTFELTGVLPPTAFEVGYSACFRAEAAF